MAFDSHLFPKKIVSSSGSQWVFSAAHLPVTLFVLHLGPRVLVQRAAARVRERIARPHVRQIMSQRARATASGVGFVNRARVVVLAVAAHPVRGGVLGLLVHRRVAAALHLAHVSPPRRAAAQVRVAAPLVVRLLVARKNVKKKVGNKWPFGSSFTR